MAVRFKTVKEILDKFKGSKEFPTGVNGLMIDRYEGDYRIIVLHDSHADIPYLKKLAKQFFGDQPYKFVLQDIIAECTNLPISSGSFIKRAELIEAGTVGGFITMPNNKVMGITNCHVIAKCGHSVNKGDQISNSSGIPVGKLHSWTPITNSGNLADLALFELEPHVTKKWHPNKPNSVIGPNIGYAVQHWGAASGRVRKGIIKNKGIIKVMSCGRAVWYNDIWTVQSTDGRPFSIKGDSGSFLRTVQGDHLVACLFAANNQYSYAFSIAQGNSLFRGGVW